MSSRETIEAVFLDAVDLPVDQRSAFLDQRCAGDSALRAEVEKLIAADQQAGDGMFLKSKLFENETPKPPIDDDNRFRVIRAYRQGGLGEVMLAHDRQLDRDVAVKQIKRDWQDSLEARQRFIQEAKVTGRLEHPGIVPVYAMGTWPDGQHYYAMRFIEGQTMKDAIDEYHQLPESSSDDAKGLKLRDLLTRFVDVCNTIQYAHSKQVLHRDIKPSNIMVGPYGETLVVDWGLAKLLDEPAEESMTADLARALGKGDGSTPTQVGGTVGTPQYMSPEQAKGKLDDIGIRTDVYLLGATLYQILTDKPPHKSDSISNLLKQVSRGELCPPRDLEPSIPPPLESICLKAMATDSVERYADAIQIADDVNRWMADQSVTVHQDSVSVRANRWMRRHRTATSSIAVATVLIAIGAVFGSILWNMAKVRKFQAEEERRSKELELQIKDRQRLSELAISAATAEALADKEIARDRFSSAYDVLENALSVIESESSLQDQADKLTAKADRIGSLVDFYRLADLVEQQNILSRDTKAILAGSTALKRLGIWEIPDWWTGLPDQDLSQKQIDKLRWDVYQQLMLMDAMLVKSIGVRLAGDGRVGGAAGALRAATRILTTNAGKTPAQAALIVSDRIDRFRLSESSRLYRSIAKMRLGTGRRLQGKDLAATRTGADAYSLAVLSMIAAVDPSFEMVFRGYQGDDSLVAARNLYSRSSALQPRYYGSHLGLGHVEYLLVQRNKLARWEDLAPALHAFGQCITLLPDRCFAYADRSSTYRFQTQLIANDERYDETERQLMIDERLRWSLQDATEALRSYDQHPWLGWQCGQAYAEIGQVNRAVELWINTGIDTYPLGEIADATIMKVDDLRGRAEIGNWLHTQLQKPHHESDFELANAYVALASIRLNQQRIDEANEALGSSLSIEPDHADALSIRGMIQLRKGDFSTAQNDFEATLGIDPENSIATFGLALCMEDAGQFAEASLGFQRSEELITSSENRAAAALGQCRTAAISGDLDVADKAVRRAVNYEPSCDLLSVARSIARTLHDWKSAGTASTKQIDELATFAKSLADLPRASNLEMMPLPDPSKSIHASMLNGGFELGAMDYWNAKSGAHWDVDSDSRSMAKVISTLAKSGDFCLMINSSTAEGVPSKKEVKVLGQTRQTISIVAGQQYLLECWIKGRGLTENAVSISGPDDSFSIDCGSGTFDWRRATTRFRIIQNADGTPVSPGTIIACPVSITASGSGTLWIDDIRCRSIPD